jgi:hypothetical protein
MTCLAFGLRIVRASEDYLSKRCLYALFARHPCFGGDKHFAKADLLLAMTGLLFPKTGLPAPRAACQPPERRNFLGCG